MAIDTYGLEYMIKRQSIADHQREGLGIDPSGGDTTFEHIGPHENNMDTPAHYMTGGIETIDYIRAKLTPAQFEGYCRGNVIKYLSRYIDKDGRRDLEKAMKYLAWLLEAVKE